MPEMFVSYLPVVTVAITAASKKALIAAADVGRNQVIKNLTGSRSGIRYKVPGTQVYYTASAPGEYPASRLGDLLGSVERKVVGGDVQIGTAKAHGLILEKKDPSKGGREWLRPSLNQAKPAMLAKLAERWF